MQSPVPNSGLICASALYAHVSGLVSQPSETIKMEETAEKNSVLPSQPVPVAQAKVKSRTAYRGVRQRPWGKSLRSRHFLRKVTRMHGRSLSG